MYFQKVRRGNVAEWDISLLISALLHHPDVAYGRNTREAKALQALRDNVRNILVHHGSELMSEGNFNALWSSAERALIDLGMPAKTIELLKNGN